MTLRELTKLGKQAGYKVRKVGPLVSIIDTDPQFPNRALVNEATGWPLFTVDEAKQFLEEEVMYFDAYVEDDEWELINRPMTMEMFYDKCGFKPNAEGLMTVTIPLEPTRCRT